MKKSSTAVVTLWLFHAFAAFLLTSVSGQSARAGAAVERHNVSAPAGSRATLRCRSRRLAQSQDRLGERQRVLHWDLFHGGSEPSVERVLDMFPSGERRVYNSANKGRVNVSSTAFLDGNFSLVIRGVGMSDRGIYSCNLHHHYCHLNESLKVQLNVTKSERKVRRSWDGEKAVFVVLLNSTVTLPCINRRPLWVKRQRESRNQVVRWDWRPLGAPWGDAERLLDVLSSGEAPERGPLFQTRRMNVSDKPFSLGDFSLTIGDLQASDEGLYSCHMHHQYCGLRKIITYQLSVVSPDLHPSAPDHPNGNQSPVVNVVISKHGGYLYVLAILLIVILFVAVVIVLLTCQFRKRGLEYHLRRPEQALRGLGETGRDGTELTMYSRGEIRPDYKNNLWKERAELSILPSPKVIDLDREMGRRPWN
ncbi:matrix remodeling-associated protein 8-like isoform X2 [Scleropages formosus]|uniref:matrix remodeling-associated protein 8-like isoform X2 n=1 Tax=Scleropages formosus TaxID=113540 RepID=UPI0010FA7808|nr:matrix remodeling-associated protein 8-like isoform X2 [Scleropages formosus]